MVNLLNSDLISQPLADVKSAESAENEHANGEVYEPWRSMDDDQRKGCVILSSRGVSDVGVCESLGITGDELISYRGSDDYREQVALQSSKLTKRDLDADDAWGRLENLALEEVTERITNQGHNMEMSEMLQAARTANAAKRKHGRLSDVGNRGIQDANGNVINVSNVTQINIPHIFLDNLQKTINGDAVVQSESELTERYAGFTNRNMDAAKVGDLLNVDLASNGKKSKNALTDQEAMRGVFEDADFSDLISDDVV